MSSNTDGENKVALSELPVPKVVGKIPWDQKGIFLHRINRFLGLVDISSDIKTKAERVHIHDPGRLEELLYPGNDVLLKKASSRERKTSWDLIAAYSRGGWVLVNSSYHSDLAEEVLVGHGIFGPVNEIKREVRVGKSRIDFLIHTTDGPMIVEVKGCTLVRGKTALFPDAPTTRGSRHMDELTNAVNSGLKAGVLFLVFPEEARCFSPNTMTDPNFSRSFYRAIDAGVEFRAVKLRYDPDTFNVVFIGNIPLCGDAK